MLPNHLNPDLVRWELHRVWVVDATLVPGKRHVVPKRRYYVDEDSWRILLIDGWDANGEPVRTNFTLTLLAPDLPALLGITHWGGYDLRTGGYYMNFVSNEMPVQYKPTPLSPADFSPEALATEGAR